MELTSLLHKKRETVKRCNHENNDFKSCFSDSQFLIIHSADRIANSKMWVAEFASIDQSDRIQLFNNEQEQHTLQKSLHKIIKRRNR